MIGRTMADAFNIEVVLQTIAAGLMVGCSYGLMCVALGLIFGVMRLINFAQGDFMMLGMYFALAVVAGLGTDGLVGSVPAVLVAALLSVPVFFALGWVVHGALLSRVGQEQGLSDTEAHQAQLIVTLGISLVLTDGGLMLFGSTPVSINTPISSHAFIIGPFGSQGVTIFLNEARVLAAVAAVGTTAALYLLLHRTALGKRLRAAADNPTAALYMGIDVTRSYRTTFGLGIGLTAAAGVMVATYYPFQPYVGLDFIVVMYAGVVLGGMGSVMGSFWGGLIIGLVQELSSLVLPLQLQVTTVFVVFLAILLIRPRGLFGRSVERA
jgi:branched-chain amino acid transport system permease protein